MLLFSLYFQNTNEMTDRNRGTIVLFWYIFRFIAPWTSATHLEQLEMILEKFGYDSVFFLVLVKFSSTSFLV